MDFHEVPLKYDKDNFRYARAAVRTCWMYREGSIFDEFLKICNEDDAWIYKFIKSPKSERYANIAMAASSALKERLAICYFNSLSGFDIRFFHTYFWYFTLENLRLNMINDLDHGIEVFEIAVVNFNILPVILNYNEDDISGLLKLMFCRIFEIIGRSRDFFLNLQTDHEINLMRASRKLYEKFNFSEAEGEFEKIFTENFFNGNKVSIGFVDQHLPELCNIGNDWKTTKKYRVTRHDPNTGAVEEV